MKNQVWLLTTRAEMNVSEQYSEMAPLVLTPMCSYSNCVGHNKCMLIWVPRHKLQQGSECKQFICELDIHRGMRSKYGKPILSTNLLLWVLVLSSTGQL